MSHSNVRKKERFHNATMVLLVAFVLEMLQLPHVHHVSLKPLLGIDKIITALAPCSRLVLHGSSQDGTKAFAVVSYKQGIAMVCVCVWLVLQRTEVNVNWSLYLIRLCYPMIVCHMLHLESAKRTCMVLMQTTRLRFLFNLIIPLFCTTNASHSQRFQVHQLFWDGWDSRIAFAKNAATCLFCSEQDSKSKRHLFLTTRSQTTVGNASYWVKTC